jgi:hypothetical protein
MVRIVTAVIDDLRHFFLTIPESYWKIFLIHPRFIHLVVLSFNKHYRLILIIGSGAREPAHSLASATTPRLPSSKVQSTTTPIHTYTLADGDAG